MERYSHFTGTITRPRWAHDCEDCVFAGRAYYGGDGRKPEQDVDVWFCTLEESVVLRDDDYGDIHRSFGRELVAAIAAADEGSIWQEAWNTLKQAEEASANPRSYVESYSFLSVRTSNHGSVTADDGETGYSIIFVTHAGVERQALIDHVAEQYPATHCQHEHDCCGQRYHSRPRLELMNEEMAVFKYPWHLNV
jgi:hypothetical protein